MTHKPHASTGHDNGSLWPSCTCFLCWEKRGRGDSWDVRESLLVGWLLNVPATCKCISGTDLLGQVTCCHNVIEVADQTFYLTQSQYTDAGLTIPSADPRTPGVWEGSHRSADFYVTGMTRPGQLPRVQAGIEPRVCRCLLGVRSLHDQGRSGDEWRRLLQFLLAAVEFGRQGSADRPHIFSCSFVKGASL